MPLDYRNPYVFKFLTENFVKENEKRVSWFIRNKEKIIGAATFRDDFKDYPVEDVYRASFELPLPACRANMLKVLLIVEKNLRDGPILVKSTMLTKPIKSRNKSEQMLVELQSDAIMKPVEPDIVKIMYKGIMYGGGRREYLRARNRKSPENKYYLDQTTNHEIGWQLKEGNKMNQPLKHGRHFTLTRDLNNRTGPQPDPHYYLTRSLC